MDQNIRIIHTYTQDRSEYEKRYDAMTIDDCRWHVRWAERAPTDKKFEKFKKMDPAKMTSFITDFSLYFVKGERYLKRDSTVNEWMERDRKQDEMIDNAQVPQNIYCENCRSLMSAESKTLHSFSDEPLRVTFMFRCANGCKRGKWIFEDGTQWKIPDPKCPTCNIELIDQTKRTKTKIICRDVCPNCNYEKVTEIDLSEKKEEIDPHFEEDRKPFCLSQEEGEQYRASFWNHDNIIRFGNQMNEREKNEPLYKAAAKLKKLTVVDLKKLLSKNLEKEKYGELTFNTPEIDQHVIVPFTVQETHSKRKDRESERVLRRLIKKILENTNWRLMSEGVRYRLGYISGRLKGYEREEDLIKILQK